MYLFALSSGTEPNVPASFGICVGRSGTVPSNRYHARQAAAALLKMAKATSDPKVVIGLVEAAADLKDQVGELPQPISSQGPDVQTDSQGRLS